MDPLIIIPARAGSRGIPHKNTRSLAGGDSPLVRAVLCAQALHGAQIVVSTDIEYYGVPGVVLVHRRPPELATDTASMADVVLDVLISFPGPDAQPVLVVHPTQPLRTPMHLQRALNLLHTCQSLASVVEVEPAEKLFFADFRPVTGLSLERRQDAQQTYRCDGTVYGFTRTRFITRPFFVGAWTHMMVVDPAESCPLDTPLDWQLAELRLRHRTSEFSATSQS